MKKFLTIFVFVVIFILAPVFVQVSIAGGAPPPPPTPVPIPIDGGLSFLLAAGVGYVAKKLYSNRENHEK